MSFLIDCGTPHRFLAALGRQLGPGFPRVVMLRRHCIKTVKAEYRARFCDPRHPVYPKTIEIRSRQEMLPPDVGEYLEIEGLSGAIVKQVGGFVSRQAWATFPFKGAGGVALDHADDIHKIPGLEETEFDRGRVWWALLEFPY